GWARWRSRPRGGHPPVHEQQAVVAFLLVSVTAVGAGAFCEPARPRRIAHVHDRRPVRRGDVGDVRAVTPNDDLTTARTVEVTDLLDAVGVAHSSSPGAEDGRPHRPRAQ